MSMNDSEVVRTLRDASVRAWKEWRRHVAAGTADSPEAIAAYAAARCAGATWINEVADRAAAARRAH